LYAVGGSTNRINKTPNEGVQSSHVNKWRSAATPLIVDQLTQLILRLRQLVGFINTVRRERCGRYYDNFRKPQLKLLPKRRLNCLINAQLLMKELL
jgi:hypothetical protein